MLPDNFSAQGNAAGNFLDTIVYSGGSCRKLNFGSAPFLLMNAAVTEMYTEKKRKTLLN